MVAHCNQLKFEYQRKFKPHLHYDITLKSQTEKKKQGKFLTPVFILFCI